MRFLSHMRFVTAVAALLALSVAGAAAALGMLLAGPVIRVADQQAAGSGVAAEGTPVR